MAVRTGTNSELMAAIRGLSAARDLPAEVILDALKAALVSAYHKIPGAEETQVSVEINEVTGEAHVFAHYTVVEERFIEDPHSEITADQAAGLKAGAAVGDSITVNVTPDDFGRIAAQTAKQVILQRIREAEREQTYTTYAEREGEIVYGTVQTASRDHVTVALDRVEALLPKSQQIPGERYSPNQRLRVYVSEVKRSPKGPQVIVSRTHRDMLKRLMELEIPEIFQGIVEAKAIAREAGSRSKVAVWSHQDGVDPVGACVGMRGVRIQALVRELGGEKIDIVQWDPDPRVFIAHALSPATVRHVGLEEDAERRTANVIVPDNQLSLAIGREGQNARLAAKLTGWRIDIRAESEAAAVLDALRAAEEKRHAERAQREQPAAEVATAMGELPVEAETAAEVGIEVAAPAEPPEVLAPAAEASEPVDAAADIGSEAPSAAAEPPATAVPTGEAAPTAGEAAEPKFKAPSWEELKGVLDVEGEEGEEAFLTGPGGKKKGKQRRLVRDPVTGELVEKKARKDSRRRPQWEYEVGRWSDDEIEEMLEFTEADFLGENEPGDTEADLHDEDDLGDAEADPRGDAELDSADLDDEDAG